MKFHEAMKLLDEGVCVRRRGGYWDDRLFLKKEPVGIRMCDDEDGNNWEADLQCEDMSSDDWEVYQEESTEESKGDADGDDELELYLTTTVGLAEVSMSVRVSKAELHAFARAVVSMYGESDEGE